MKLRPYQQDAVSSVLQKWNDFRKTILVLPTGGGKTIVFSHIAHARRNAGRTLILAHRDELISQAIEKLYSATGIKAEREQADHHASSDADVVVASVQTMQRRLDKWRDAFATVIVDEAHHVLSDSYQEVLGAFDMAKVLGVTATPDRGDKKSLGQYFEEVAYEVGMLDLIKQGYLSKVYVKSIPLNIDLSKVRTVAGDFSDSDSADAIEPYLEVIADALIKEAGDRKTLVFLPLIRTSMKMVEILKSKGMKSMHVDGMSDNRSEILASFSDSKEPIVLCNSMLLTEGYDCPSIDCIMCLRPTKSRSLYSQMVGRGTRISDGKGHLLILDPLCMTGRHSLIKPAHLIAKSESVVEHVHGDGDLEAMMENAEHDLEKSLKKKLDDEAKKSKFRKKGLLDPFNFGLDIDNIPLADWTETMPWHSAPVSENQAKLIGSFGLDVEKVRNKGHASALIDTLMTRRNAKLATPTQVMWLKRFFYKNPNAATFEQASAFLKSKFGK
jgi:superfamily II DNA or RNA helicase